jgi:hypothetical protein
MGQVIAFPKQKRQAGHARLAATLKTLCTLVYLFGFFIVGPTLIVFGFAFAFGAQPVAALLCIAALLVDWAVTKAAYTRL